MSEKKLFDAYPSEFVSRVKACFPEDGALHAALDTTSYSVGEKLVQKSNSPIAATALDLLHLGKYDELKALLEKSIQAQTLLTEWYNLPPIRFA